MRERDIENYLVKCVNDMGGEVRKVQWIGRRGAPDRLVMLPPSFKRDAGDVLFYESQTIWVELKAPGAKPRPSQEREHERMRAMGQHVEVIDSLQGVDELLMKEKNK